jgi:hypothetical protein
VAGKKKIETETSGEGWWGAREGAGRPKTAREYNEELRKSVKKALKEMTKSDGRTIGRILVEAAYSDKVSDALKLGALKLITEISTIKEQDVQVTLNAAPSIYLPERMEEPTE